MVSAEYDPPSGKKVYTHTHVCTHTCTHSCTHQCYTFFFFYQCHTLDFTKFTAEEVNSHTQIVLNILKSFLSNESSIGFKFKLKFMNTNFNKIKTKFKWSEKFRTLVTFQVLYSHVWLLSTLLDKADLNNCRKYTGKVNLFSSEA